MPVLVGFERSSNTPDTLFFVNEGDGIFRLTVKRELYGSSSDLNFWTYFKLDVDHLQGISSSDYEILTDTRNVGSHWDGYYGFDLNEDEFEIRIRINDDDRDESDVLEGLRFTITDLGYLATLEQHVIASQHDDLSQVASIQIIDNDQPAQITVDVDNDVASEGDRLVFRLNADGDLPETAAINWRVVSGHSHVTQTSGTEYIAAGYDVGFVRVPTRIDSDMSNETVRIEIWTTTPGVLVGDDRATGTVVDTTQATLPQVFVDDAGAVDEGGFANFTVRVVGEIAEPVTVTVATYIGTANADGVDTDYDGIGDATTPDRVLTFNPGEPQSQTVSVFVTANDTEGEPDETFELRVLSVENAAVVDGVGAAIIVDQAPHGPDVGESVLHDAELLDLFDTLIAQASGVDAAEISFKSVQDLSEDQNRVIQETVRRIELDDYDSFGTLTPDGYQRMEDVNFFGRIYLPSLYAELARNAEVGGGALSVGEALAKAGDAFEDDNVTLEEASSVVSSTVTSGASGFLGAAGATMIFGSNPGGWVIIAAVGTAFAIAVVADTAMELSGGEARFEQAILDLLKSLSGDNTISQVDVRSFDGGSSTSFGGSVITPNVEYDSNYNAVFEPKWHIDNVVISDESVEAGEVVTVSYQIVQPEELYNIDANFTVSYYLSEDRLVSPDDDLLEATTDLEGLLANHSANVDVSFATGDGFDGSYYLLAAVQSSTYSEGALISVPLEITGGSTGSSGGSSGSSSGGQSTATPTTSGLMALGTADFAIGTTFQLDQLDGHSGIIGLATTSGARNFITVIVHDTLNELIAEVAWVENGTPTQEYVRVPLADINLTLGEQHDVVLERVNQPDGSAQLSLYLDGVLIGETLAATTPDLAQFDVATSGSVVGWSDSNTYHVSQGTFGEIQYGDPGALFADAATGQSAPSPDVTPPTVSIVGLLDGETVSGTITVDLDISDSESLIDVAALTFAGQFMGFDEDSPYSYQIDTAQFADGTYVLKAEAADSAGNDGLSEITLVVQNDPAIVFTYTDGQGEQAPAGQWWHERFNGTNGTDIIDGGAGNDIFRATAGDDFYQGGAGDNDQASFYETGMAISDLTWSYDSDEQMLRSEHTVYGTDYYDQTVEAFWGDGVSVNGATWIGRQFIIDNWATAFTYDPAAIGGSAAEVVPERTTFNDGDGTDVSGWSQHFAEQFFGTQFAGDEFIYAGDDADDIVASSGDDIIDGQGGYDQVTHLTTLLADLSIGAAADGSIHIQSAETGYDIYRGIEAWWFEVDQVWLSTSDLATRATDDFVFA